MLFVISSVMRLGWNWKKKVAAIAQNATLSADSRVQVLECMGVDSCRRHIFSLSLSFPRSFAESQKVMNLKSSNDI